ncbi:uncharacterized protein A4U43_C08F2870 [Asparagus officinalis]|nr:uncharacterized protein A4U43_C08F2870 [Asparagus officinalis]
MRATVVKVLRVVNAHDVITRVPVLPHVAEGKMDSYAHVGRELKVDSKISPYLRPNADPGCCHDLEAYLHLVDGFMGSNCPFRANAKRSLVRLVNQQGSNFKQKYVSKARELVLDPVRDRHDAAAYGYWRERPRGGGGAGRGGDEGWGSEAALWVLGIGRPQVREEAAAARLGQSQAPLRRGALPDLPTEDRANSGGCVTYVGGRSTKVRVGVSVAARRRTSAQNYAREPQRGCGWCAIEGRLAAALRSRELVRWCLSEIVR